MTKENNNWLNAVAKPQANMIANQIKESKNDREHRYYTQKLNNWQMLVAETLQITPDEAADILTGTEEDSPFRREVRAWTQRREAAQADIKAGADLEGVASRYLEAPGVVGETFVARLIATTTDALAKAETDNDRDAAAADFLANLQGWHNSHPILQSDIQEEDRDMIQNDTPTPKLALVQHGHYLLETMITQVVKLTADEAKSCNAEVRDWMHQHVDGADEIEILRGQTSPTMDAITHRPDDGMLHYESRIYYITQAQADTIMAEINAAEAAKAEAEQARKDKIAAEKQAKYDEAAATGKPVRIRRWMEECNNSRAYDCSMDTVTEYAMPDGSTKTERHHAY